MPPEDDVKLLWRIGQGKYNDAAHTRALAYQEGGLAAWHRSDRQQCARFYSLCLAVPTDDGEAIAIDPTTQDPTSRVHIELAKIQADVRINLRRIDEIPSEDDDDSGYPARADRPDAGGRHTAVRGPQDPLLGSFVQMSLRLSKPNECDECGKSTSDQRFLTCRRCKARYYCSPQCQKTAWDRPGPAGHQQCCRAPGKLRPGDLAQVRSLIRSQDLNGLVVEVRGLDPKAQDRFSVKVQPRQPNEGRIISVKPENLVYLSSELRWPDRELHDLYFPSSGMAL